MHHGRPLDVRADRLISPTAEEWRDGVLEVQVLLAWCSEEKPRCRKDFVITRHRYAGGWGPAHRTQEPAQKANYRRRCKIARESDIVQGSQSQWPYLPVKRVAGA